MNFYRHITELVPELQALVTDTIAVYPTKNGMDRSIIIDNVTGSVKVSLGKFIPYGFNEVEHRVFPNVLGPLVELPTPDWMEVDDSNIDGGNAYLRARWCRRADLETILRDFILEALARNP